MRIKTFQFIILLVLALVGSGQIQAQDIHKHKLWNQVLEKYVNNDGNVNYKALKNNHENLDAYLDRINENPPQPSWSENQKKAYLINAYNAFTLKLILENYPLESIRDIGGLFNNPFTTEFANIGNKDYSLDDIEKGMLLKMGDPRVHFAVNCASESCPKLQNEAFVASKLDQQLDSAAREFINSDKNELSSDAARLSKIFKWYSSDFETDENSVIDFINRYSKEKISEDAAISFLPYSWKLNEN